MLPQRSPFGLLVHVAASQLAPFPARLGDVLLSHPFDYGQGKFIAVLSSGLAALHCRVRKDFLSKPANHLSCVMEERNRIAHRFGRTYHRSWLRFRLQRLWENSAGAADNLEDWLVEVANRRTADAAASKHQERSIEVPSLEELANEELIVGMLLLENVDRPQLIPAAGRLLAQIPVNQKELSRLAFQERVDFLLKELHVQNRADANA